MLKLRGRKIETMQWMSLALVVVFGSLTLYLHDPRFVMIKPTLIYLAVAAVMLRPGWMIRYLPPIAADYAPDLGVVFGYVWAAMMGLTALANVALVAVGDPELWAWFVGVVPLTAKLALFLIQFTVFRLVVGRRLKRAARAGVDDVGVMTAN